MEKKGDSVFQTHDTEVTENTMSQPTQAISLHQLGLFFLSYNLHRLAEGSSRDWQRVHVTDNV